MVVEVIYLTWTEGGLLRAVSYEGQREDKPARRWCGPFPMGSARGGEGNRVSPWCLPEN